VLEDTLDRSLQLAASMDARGFGRRGKQTPGELLTARLIGLVGLLLNLFGIFFLLSGLGSLMALALIAAGILSGFISVRITSRRKVRTNLVKQQRVPLDYLAAAGLVALLVANFAGWLR
jgi:energy-coupling factor transport system permease protein